ncbi:hypothetical protein FRC17_001082 [Serendipita sp. 399]|nr:hypothetical protein FRC17_001082 [Serendipita sp. 399]
MSHFVSEMMTHPDGTVQVAFERFGSYLLAKKFASFTSIADIFGDNIPNTLKDKKARLVSIRKRSNLTIRHPLDITSPDWPTYRLGSKCSKYEEVLSWCEDPAGTAFCFPPSHMGLDLILILELESEGTLVAALVQFNQLTQLYMTQVQTKSAINAVDPNLFYVPREPEAKESTEANKRREEINQALRSLLGTGFVPLRVCMAYSVMPNQSAIQKMNDPKEFYPVAIANLQSLATTSEETKTLQSLVQKLQVAIMQ